jgi:hypothetical protein
LKLKLLPAADSTFSNNFEPARRRRQVAAA